MTLLFCIQVILTPANRRTRLLIVTRWVIAVRLFGRPFCGEISLEVPRTCFSVEGALSCRVQTLLADKS